MSDGTCVCVYVYYIFNSTPNSPILPFLFCPSLGCSRYVWGVFEATFAPSPGLLCPFPLQISSQTLQKVLRQQ